jgi:hypothetical protein
MKLNESQLRNIIKESIKQVLKENYFHGDMVESCVNRFIDAYNRHHPEKSDFKTMSECIRWLIAYGEYNTYEEVDEIMREIKSDGLEGELGKYWYY